MRTIILTVFCTLITTSAAWAQAGGKVETVNFDDYMISGQQKKASGLYLFERRHGDLQSLIEIRKDYRDEISASVDE